MHILGEPGLDGRGVRLRAAMVKGFRRFAKASCSDAQELHPLGMDCCAVASLDQLIQRANACPQAANESSRVHGCSISSARAGWSFERWNATQPQIHRNIGIGLTAGLPITIRFE